MNKIFVQIYKKLLEEYGSQGWWPVYSLRNTEYRDGRGYYYDYVQLESHRKLTLGKLSEFEIAIGAVLTQNTAWTNVEKALGNLIKQNLIDPKGIMDIDQEKLADLIRPSGYYNQKAEKIKILTHFLLTGGYFQNKNIPARENLLALWGIGEETADSILLYAYNVPLFVVDAYTKRIFKRLGILEGKEKYKEIAGLFTDSLGKDYLVFQEYHALMVQHAKEHCRKKPICKACVLNNLCKKNI